MAASRSPVIKASGTGGVSGGLGSSITALFSRLADRKKEREREEDERILQEAKNEGSRIQSRVQSQVNALRASDQWAEMDAQQQRDALNDIWEPQLTAFKQVGGGKIEYDSVYADLDLARANKVDEYIQPAVKENRKDAFQRKIAEGAVRYDQVLNDIEIQQERLSDPDAQVIDNATRQLPSLYDEAQRLAVESAPSDSVAHERMIDLQTRRRNGPLQAALMVPARRGDRIGFEAVVSRMRNGSLKFAVGVSKQDRDELVANAASVMEDAESRHEKIMEASEKAQETEMENGAKALWRAINMKDQDNEFMVSVADAHSMITSSEGYKLRDKEYIKMANELVKHRKDSREADDEQAEASILASPGNAKLMNGYLEKIATTSSMPDLQALELKVTTDRMLGLLTKEQEQDNLSLIKSKMKLEEIMTEGQDDVSKSSVKVWNDAKAFGIGMLGHSDHMGRLIPHQGIKQQQITMFNRAMVHLDAWAQIAQNPSPQLYESVMDIVMARVMGSSSNDRTRAKSLIDLGAEGERLASSLIKAGTMPNLKDTAGFALIGTGEWQGNMIYHPQTGMWDRSSTMIEVDAYYERMFPDNMIEAIQAAASTMDHLDRTHRLITRLRANTPTDLFTKEPD